METCVTEQQKSCWPNANNLCDRTTEILLTERKKLVYGNRQLPNDKPRSDRTPKTCVWQLAVPERQTQEWPNDRSQRLPCHLRGVAVKPSDGMVTASSRTTDLRGTLPSEGGSCQPLRWHGHLKWPCRLRGVSTSWLTMNFTVRYTKPPSDGRVTWSDRAIWGVDSFRWQGTLMLSVNSDKIFLYQIYSAPCVTAINGKILYCKPNSSLWDNAFREKMYKETKSSPRDQRFWLWTPQMAG